jgi:hypothetical protein
MSTLRRLSTCTDPWGCTCCLSLRRTCLRLTAQSMIRTDQLPSITPAPCVTPACAAHGRAARQVRLPQPPGAARAVAGRAGAAGGRICGRLRRAHAGPVPSRAAGGRRSGRDAGDLPQRLRLPPALPAGAAPCPGRPAPQHPQGPGTRRRDVRCKALSGMYVSLKRRIEHACCLNRRAQMSSLCTLATQALPHACGCL